MQSACWLITLDDFRALGKMTSHEHANDANLFTAVYEYEYDSWSTTTRSSSSRINGKRPRSLTLTSSSTTR